MSVSLTDFDPIPVERETFIVDNDAKADWALRRLGSIRKQIAEAEALAEAERERVQSWLDHVRHSFEADITYFEGQLRQYGEIQREAGRKTVDLPHGKIKTRQVSAKFEVVDKDSFLAWARDNAPDLIKVTEAPSLSAMNSTLAKAQGADAAVTPDGEVVPGVSVTPATVSLTFETN